jgi:hypothetical protein
MHLRNWYFDTGGIKIMHLLFCLFFDCWKFLRMHVTNSFADLKIA